MSPSPSIAKIRELNDEYGMFYSLGDGEGLEHSRFHFSAKDNLTTRDHPTTAGSKILYNYRPPFDAAAVAKLREAGGVLLGKTSMDEFGFGTFSVNSAFEVPRNPYDRERSCGGSSGGAACAAALIDGHLALGVSTGGSISCPAAFCGVYGFTPTYGRVSRYGLLDYGNSLDKVGMLAADCATIAELFPLIAGSDERDPTSCGHPPMGECRVPDSIGIPSESIKGLPEKILESFNDAVTKMKDDLGIEVRTLEMPMFRYAQPAYYIIATSEASTNLARYGGMRYGARGKDLGLHFDRYFTSVRSENFGAEAKRRILLGTFTRMVGLRDRYYLRALQVRQAVIEEYRRAFKDVDAILTPTMPFIAPRFDEVADMSALEIYLADHLTIPPNLSGMPHLSIPCGYVDGMPVGMQLVADHWDEGCLLQAGMEWGRLFERIRPEAMI